MEFKLIAPKRPSLDDVLLYEVRARGLPADDLVWFVQAFVEEAKLTASEETLLAFCSRSRWAQSDDLNELLQRWEQLLSRLVATWSASHDLADLMLDLISPLWYTGGGETIRSPKAGYPDIPLIPQSIAQRAIAECKRRKLDLTAAASKETYTGEVRRLIALLDKEGLLDADKVVQSSLPRLLQLADAKSLINGQRFLHDLQDHQRAAELPLYWLRNDPERFGRVFLPWLDRVGPAERGKWACAFCAGFSAASAWVRTTSVWFENPPVRSPRFLRVAQDASVAHVEAQRLSLELIQAVFDRLDHWRRTATAPMTWDEARAWMACYMMRSSADTHEWYESILPEAGAVALEQLGRMRPIVRNSTGSSGGSLPQGWSEHLSHCVQAAEEAGLWWEALERLLLLFRELRVPAVLSNLRYWYEHPEAKQGEGSPTPEQPPKYWSLIPRLIARTIHGAASHYSESDESLTELRTRFAEFCINRISSRKGSSQPAESDPYWRAAYIGALGELYCNPSGRGHQAIYTMILENKNEDSEVKEIAKAVYDDLRHARKLPNQISPRVALFSAFLWLRQAHLICTDGRQPSGDMSIILLQEVRRTTEPLTPQEVE